MGTSTQNWMTGLIFYFVLIFIVVSLFSFAGAFGNDELNARTHDFTTDDGTYNSTGTPPTSGSYSWGQYFTDIFSFFGWNISYYATDTPIISQYFWIIRIFIVYLPLLLLLITFYYSLPTVSG